MVFLCLESLFLHFIDIVIDEHLFWAPLFLLLLLFSCQPFVFHQPFNMHGHFVCAIIKHVWWLIVDANQRRLSEALCVRFSIRINPMGRMPAVLCWTVVLGVMLVHCLHRLCCAVSGGFCRLFFNTTQIQKQIQIQMVS